MNKYARYVRTGLDSFKFVISYIIYITYNFLMEIIFIFISVIKFELKSVITKMWCSVVALF